MKSFYGSVARTIDGEVYRFVLDFNAIVHFEDATGEKFFDLSRSWEEGEDEPEVRHLCALCHASLQEHHDETTIKDAGRLLSKDLGVIEALMTAAGSGVSDEDADAAPVQADGKKKIAAAQ